MRIKHTHTHTQEMITSVKIYGKHVSGLWKTGFLMKLFRNECIEYN